MDVSHTARCEKDAPAQLSGNGQSSSPSLQSVEGGTEVAAANRPCLSKSQDVVQGPAECAASGTSDPHAPNQSTPGEASSVSVNGNMATQPLAPFWHRWLMRRFLAALGNPPVAVDYANGSTIASASARPQFRVTLSDRASFWKLILDPMFQFAELYTVGKLTLEGDLVEFLCNVFRSMSKQVPGWGPVDWLRRWLRTPVNTLTRSRANAAHHYDLGNAFYKLWLDEQMVYTCAYYRKPDMSLEEAQVAKMEHVCRKLRLAPGQRVLELGCGWGALAIYMAQKYGVHVRACNVSGEQIAYARDRARALGLSGQVEFLDEDWRNMTGVYDRVVSVGMLEHVGLANYHRLGAVLHACLKRDGIGLLHSIGRNFPAPVNPWIRARIFPGGYAPSLQQIMQIFEPWDLSVLDVENIRLHYAQTLKHWLERFERAVDYVRQTFGDRFVRMWRFYLACSQAAFETGGLQLFQIVFSHGSNNLIPRTRSDLYENLT